MDQEAIVESIGKHLDTVETYVKVIALLAVAAAWAGIRRSREIDALGTKFDRRHAFWALATLYLIANTAVLIVFLRLGDLVLLLKAPNVVKGVTKLATHSWVLNPFSYFGQSHSARFYSSEGYGLLIATWWLCNASLSTLMNNKRHRGAQALLGVFLLVGLGSMLAINRVYAEVLVTLRTCAPELYRAAVSTATDRSIGNVLGIVVGGLIFAAANRLQSQRTNLGTRAGLRKRPVPRADPRMIPPTEVCSTLLRLPEL